MVRSFPLLPSIPSPDEILSELVPVRHSKPMLSAAKTKSTDDFIRFIDGRPAVLSWKLDGLTIVLRYSNGQLTQAITRGREGIVGEDVTHTVRTFLNVPLSVPFLEEFEVRGEGVISWANFDSINRSLEDPYTHPRGLAAGSTRKLDPAESKKRSLEFLAFDLVTDLGFTRKTEQLDFLAQQGFSVVPHTFFDKDTTPGHIHAIISTMKPNDYAYPVDGLIIEFDDLAYHG